MKLYFSRGACSMGPRIIINELGLMCEYEAVDLKTKQTETGENFLEINPKGAVPTLITDNNQILTEANVILQYLAHVAKSNEIFPPVSDFEHFRELEWLNFVASDLHKGVGILFNPKITQEMKNEIFMPMIESKMNFIEKNLEGSKYLMKDKFTLPDAYLFVILTWLFHFKFNFKDYPNVSWYFNELKKRPSIVKSMQEEGLLAKA